MYVTCIFTKLSNTNSSSQLIHDAVISVSGLVQGEYLLTPCTRRPARQLVRIWTRQHQSAADRRVRGQYELLRAAERSARSWGRAAVAGGAVTGDVVAGRGFRAAVVSGASSNIITALLINQPFPILIVLVISLSVIISIASPGPLPWRLSTSMSVRNDVERTQWSWIRWRLRSE